MLSSLTTSLTLKSSRWQRLYLNAGEAMKIGVLAPVAGVQASWGLPGLHAAAIQVQKDALGLLSVATYRAACEAAKNETAPKLQ